MSNIKNIGNVTDIVEKHRDVIFNVDIVDSDGKKKTIELVPGCTYNVNCFCDGKKTEVIGNYIGRTGNAFIKEELSNRAPCQYDYIDDSFNTPNFDSESRLSFDCSEKNKAVVVQIRIFDIIDIIPTIIDPEVDDTSFKTILNIPPYHQSSFNIRNNSITIFDKPISNDNIISIVNNLFISTDTNIDKSVIFTVADSDILYSEVFNDYKSHDLLVICTINNDRFISEKSYNISQRNTVITIEPINAI